MQNQEFMVNGLETIEGLANITSNCAQQYGNLLSVDLYYVQNDDNQKIASFKNSEELLSGCPKEIYDISNLVEISLIAPDKNAVKVNIDKTTNIAKVRKINLNMTVGPKNMIKPTPVQTYEQALADPNCKYYKFDNGVVAKFDPAQRLYYILDEANNWKMDGRVITWLIDAQYDYIELDSSEKKRNNGGLSL